METEKSIHGGSPPGSIECLKRPAFRAAIEAAIMEDIARRAAQIKAAIARDPGVLPWLEAGVMRYERMKRDESS